jgi:RHS repeat-associated protein
MLLDDRSGTLLEAYRYDSFGTPTILAPGGTIRPQSAVGNPYGFTGREFDAESGLHYFRRRYYDPRTGRFLNEDPLGGDIALPMSFNPYPYASNNPLRFTDPFGLGEVADRTAEELRTRLGQHLSEEQIQKMGTAVERAGVIGFKDVLTLKFGSPQQKEAALRHILERLEQKAKKDPEQQKLLDEFKEAMRKADPQQGAECPVP